MTIRTVVGVGVVAVFAGYGAAVAKPAVTQMPPRSLDLVLVDGCPDGSTNCTHSNGTGVYAAEGGTAYLGANQFMITHFINNADSNNVDSFVTFKGRSFDATQKIWRNRIGTILNAEYHPKTGPQLMNLQVVSVSESSTIPTWTLRDTTVSPPGNALIVVTDSQLYDLKINISIGAGILDQYVLDFNQTSPAQGQGGQAIRKYNMRWRSMSGNGPPTQYCRDANYGPDQVVFQQGMDVDPVTGMVQRAQWTKGMVTLSCFLGAPATVYGWGYPYQGAPTATFYFDAGIQMKRASYCGDSHYYTVAGTPIHIVDDKHIQSDYPDYKSISPLEASWGPKGALCLNMDNAHMRHWQMAQDSGFDGKCNNKLLPQCPPLAPPVPPLPVQPQQFLADGPKFPSP